MSEEIRLPELKSLQCEGCMGTGKVGRPLASWEQPVYGPGSQMNCPQCHGLGWWMVSPAEHDAEMKRRELERSVSEARTPWDEIWMGLAESLAGRSTCSRKRVGAAIVSADNTRVLAVGYNGGAKGVFNACKSLEPGQCGHLHAEENALIKANYSESGQKKIYISSSPCFRCAVAIVNAGVGEVIWGSPYRFTDGLDLLGEAKVRVRQFPPPGQ